MVERDILDIPLDLMFLAAFTSRSSSYPQERQACFLTDKDFGATSPHSLHVCVVWSAETLTT
jgi:hypothetical protein